MEQVNEIDDKIIREWIEKAKPLVDSAWNLALDEAIRVVNTQQIRWAETYFTPEAVVKEIIEKLIENYEKD